MNTHALVSYTRYKHAAVGGAFDLPTQVTLTIQYYYYCAIDYFGQFHCIIKLILMHVHALQWRPGGGCVHGRCVCVCHSALCVQHMYSHIAMETGNHSCGNLMLPNLKEMPHFYSNGNLPCTLYHI